MPKDNQIPERYRCSITGEIMIDPVFAADGHTYEREGIAQWLKTNDTSPKTNIRLKHKELTDSHYTRSDVLEFLDSYPELYEGDEIYMPKSWMSELARAIKENQLQDVQRWLDKDRRLLTLKLEDDATALHLACEFSSPELVEVLLNILQQKNKLVMGWEIKFKSTHLNVLLQQALIRGDCPKCELLVGLGAEVEQPEAITQNTLLHQMVIRDNLEAISWLLEHNAILESRNCDGNTPLLLSVIHKHKKISEFLLKMDANLEVKNLQKKLAFYIAVEKNDLEMAKLLLAYGANPALIYGENQLSVLHLRAQDKADVMLEYLLETKAIVLIDIQDANGNTPLHLAVNSLNHKAILVLLEAGAYHKIKNEESQTPIDLAIANESLEIADCIFQKVRHFKKSKLKETDRLHRLITAQNIKIRNLEAVLNGALALEEKEENETIQKIKLDRDPLKIKENNSKSDISFIEAIKQGNQEEIFRVLTIKTDSFGEKFIDEVDSEYGGSVLYWAANYGLIHLIDSLVKEGVDINQQNKNGETPMYAAARNGDPQVITLLKSLGAAVDTPDEDGATPVYIAAYEGNVEAIIALNAAAADMNKPDNCNHAPVYAAALNGHAKAIAALKASGANIDALNNKGETPLYIAAEQGHKEAIVALISAGANVNTLNHDGETPIFSSAKNGHSSAITALHTAGADVNTKNKHGLTPICFSAENGHAEAVTIFHTLGADVNTPCTSGLTPIFFAAENGHASTIAALRAEDANVNARNNDDETPVYVAAKKGHAAAIAALHAAGADVNATKSGTTPVYVAAENGHTEAITSLITAGADVNILKPDGTTSVYAASLRGYAETIVVLHAAGANVDTGNNNDETPVYAAAEHGHATAIAALHTVGANVNTANHDGMTPVFVAAQNNHPSTITALHAAGANMNTAIPDSRTPMFMAAQLGNPEAITALLAAGADASIKTQWGTALEYAKRSKEPGQLEVVRRLEAHLKQCPNGVKPIEAHKNEVVFRANVTSTSEQKNPPVLIQFEQKSAILPQKYFPKHSIWNSKNRRNRT